MRLLAVADQEPHIPLERLVAHHKPDAVVLLGDLLPDWLDPLCRFSDLSILGVYGNHDDGHYLEARNLTDVHLSTAEVGEARFTGFEGCVQYRWGAPLQYTQDEATRMARKLPEADVLLSHAPPAGVHEEPHDDRAHEGFEALREYVERVQPRLAIHGHTPPPPRPPEYIGRTKVVHVVGASLVTVP
jgi:Icc-related predicted phosphoesterase